MLRYAALATLALLSRAWGEALPDTMLGLWDVSPAACARGFAYSTTRTEIEAERIFFHYGHAGIAEVEVSRAEGRAPVAFLRADLIQEGSVEPGPEVVFFRLEQPEGPDMLGFTWKDGDRQDLIRCDPEAPDGSSRYTSLDLAACAVLSVSDEGGGASLRCAGREGVDLFVTEGDLRFDVDVGRPDDAFIGLSPFNTLGDMVEWRYGPEGSLRAVILRYHFETGVDGAAIPSELAVIRPGYEGMPSCYVAFVPPEAAGGQNAAARAIADSAMRRPCIAAR